MTHAMRPVVGEVHKQEEDQPVVPGGWVEREEGEFFEEEMVHRYGEHWEKKPWQLRGDPAAEVGDGVGKAV